MRRTETICICDLGIIASVANLIMCRLTGGLWLFVMGFRTRIGKRILKLLLNLVLAYATGGLWVIFMAFRLIVRPIVSKMINK